jgi:hypothetical protein
MGNHYHLVLHTRQANLSRFMRHLNGVYTQSFNRRHVLVGHLFQGRFKAILVDRDAYLLTLCRYVERNPVAASLVRQPADWAWSSCRAHLRAQRSWPGASLRQLLSQGMPRDAALHRAYTVGGQTMSELAREVGLSVSRVSRLIAGEEAKGMI